MQTFIELSAIVFITTALAGIMRVLRQPLVVGYIISGVIVGPYVLNILHSVESIELFSKIGISILLFIVGLSLNPATIKETGRVSLVTGLGQVLFTSVIGFLIMRGLGFEIAPSIYGSIALTFSSTIIILKLLSDKGDLNKLYGKIAIGFLLVQDIVATIILLVVSASGEGGSLGSAVVMLTVRGIVAISALYIVSKYFLPRVSAYFARSQELLFLFSLSWGLGLASLFYYLGFSIEIGALIAGVTLSVSSYAYEIGSRMKPLRDFFVVLFFVLLGSHIILADISSVILPAIILSLFVLIGNPLIVFILMNLLGYRTRVGFMAGLTVAQISEFSLILMTLGLTMGHIDRQVVSLITLVGIITISGSTYLILYADKIYESLKGFLRFLEIRHKYRRVKNVDHGDADVIIFGFDRVGVDFVSAAEKITGNYLVVDFNPSSIERLKTASIPFRFGDAEDVEFLQEIGLTYAKIVASTIPDFKTNKLLVRQYRQGNSTGIIIVLSHDLEEAKELYLEGASYVIMPHHLGAHHASKMIADYGFDIEAFEKERNKHLAKLARREKIES